MREEGYLVEMGIIRFRVSRRMTNKEDTWQGCGMVVSCWMPEKLVSEWRYEYVDSVIFFGVSEPSVAKFCERVANFAPQKLFTIPNTGPIRSFALASGDCAKKCAGNNSAALKDNGGGASHIVVFIAASFVAEIPMLKRRRERTKSTEE